MEAIDIQERDFPSLVPDLIWRARDPAVGWGPTLGLVLADFDSGVEVVCVFDSGSNTSCIFGPDQPPRVVEHGRRVGPFRP